jgi:AraC-like DNA-binding protein
MPRQRLDPPRGLLNLAHAEQRVTLGRYVPSDAEISFFVEHFWTVRWDLRGLPPFTSESLPYPSVHVVLERGNSRVVGVPTGRFSRTLKDAGAVFGIKFRPGAFHAFAGGPIARFTDTSVSVESVLDYGAGLEDVILGARDDAAMVDHAEDILRKRLPPQDEHIPFLIETVDRIAADRTLIRVDQLVSKVGPSRRVLQQLFRDYVGVSPKWVIQRYRLFEAAERLAAGEADGARVAHDLGYFDQAHFIRDFKAMVGTSPVAFARADPQPG